MDNDQPNELDNQPKVSNPSTRLPKATKGKIQELLDNPEIAHKRQVKHQEVMKMNTFNLKHGTFSKYHPTPQYLQSYLSYIFHDSFYYGVLNQAKQQVDLRDLYDFEPAVSEDDFNHIQSLSYRRIKPSKSHALTFYPLRLMVHCLFCGMTMRVGASKSRMGKRLLYYRCDNKSCTRKKKSIRAKVIFVDFLYKFLEDGLHLTEVEYKKYYEGISQITDQKRQKLRIELNSKRGALKVTKREIDEVSRKILDYKKEDRIWIANRKRLDELEDLEKQFVQDIAKLEKLLANPERDKLSLEQFLNLSKNADKIAKSPIPEVKDAFCRKIFLNLTVDEEKVASYRLKPPFDVLLKHRQQSLGRGDRN